MSSYFASVKSLRSRPSYINLPCINLCSNLKMNGLTLILQEGASGMDIEKGRGGFKALAKGYDRHPHRFIGKVKFFWTQLDHKKC